MLNDLANEFNTNLLLDKDKLKYIKDRRGVNEESIIKYKIGYDKNKRKYTIPIYENGEVVNIRLWQDKEPKMVSYAEGLGAVRLYMLDNIIGNDIVYLCEGEWDCILLNQYGFSAITSTGGANTFKRSWRQLFKNKKVVLLYDCDNAGREGAKKIVETLQDIVDWIKNVDLKLGNKEDITDWFVKHKKTKNELLKLIEDTKKQDEYREILLKDSLKADLYDKKIKFQGIVIGKDMQPYIIPKKIRVKCNNLSLADKKICESCMVRDGMKEITFDYDKNKDLITRLTKVNDMQLIGYIRNYIGLPSHRVCPAGWSMDIEERMNVEDILIVPKIDEERVNEDYVQRQAFYFGYNIKTNQSYEFRGTTWADPSNQIGIHLIKNVVSSKDNIEEFKLTKKIKEQLKIFQPESDDLHSITKKLSDIYKDLATNVTHMIKRENIIMATDLVYHSALSFYFLNRKINKGWLECTIIGDTRCGKSETVQKLIQHYRAGEFITSGENSTRAGILGGLQKSNGRWHLTWGKIPINDKRLVVLDETDELSKKGIIGLLSGVRSSGIAEVVQIQSQRANARTRLIFISNPLWGKLTERNYGIEAIREIFKVQQDISRIDFVIGVSENDVPKEEINKRDSRQYDHKYTSDICHNSVMFAWSRKPDNIIIREDTAQIILDMANKISDDFSSDIPIVLSSEMRIKLARMAVSLAIRLYSVDETGENVIVKPSHVMAIMNFLYHEYKSSSLGYYDFSEQKKRDNTLGNITEIDKGIGNDIDKVNLLLDVGQIFVSDIEDIFQQDMAGAKDLISIMRRNRMIKKKSNFYVKTPPFIAYLKAKKQLLEDNNHNLF